ncbi:EAL domain-containing protein [Paenibacillus nanensis]|uniref:EAL domain-containing protein n=1 Tax=Paenibacillus nanensis TaxID=393251 RepID=A0A3A1V1K6_9BACL|nr:EAL domain-containing protein [Paenibacillus nanensis]RIX51470.1 EAL domain-containing protein [Paenibacillus nanensis]
MDHVHGNYDIALVVFSYLVAVVASYTVLDLVGRISTSVGRFRWLWLLFGAAGMAMGVWSMHFIGMLAFSLHVPVAYDLITVVESYIAILAGSFLSLIVVGRERLEVRHLLGGGLLLAAGIVAMHYWGMEAMQINISYDPYYVALSVVIAIGAAITAFWLSFYFRKGKDSGKMWKKLASGFIMGAAVVGMHYTGMFAAEFYLGDKFNSTAGIILDQKRLAYFIACGTLLTLGLSILGIFISNRFASKESEIQAGFTWYKSLFDNNQDGIIAVDLEYRITGFNPAMAELLGLNGDLPLNRSIDEILHYIAEEEQEHTRESLQRSFSGELQNYETAIVRRNGERVELHGINVPVVVDGRVVGSYIIARDITDEKRYKNMIRHQAYHDELTGLPNRRMFNQLLTEKIESKTERFAVMVIDIDRFKMINDSLGHLYGDQFLQEMSRRIQDCIAGMNVTAARMGGDEFTLLCDGAYSYRDLSKMVERIIRAISYPYRLKDNDFYVTASIGIALYPGDGSDAVQLLKNADTAMYEVKKNGKNGYRFYSSDLNNKLQDRIELEAHLRKALAANEFFLHYQPQVRAANNELIGVEALVRWQHPSRGVISPGVFIPIAEETGIIYELGTWVLREACRQMKEWHMAGGPRIPISVNLSSQQFHQANLGAHIHSILEETGLEPQYLELEITESMMMDPAVSNSILSELSEYGIRLSLDDFGTGYSSLSYLKLLPVQKLKIDRSFIRDITENPNDKAIVATIVSMAKHLNMDVIAEGIETKEQLDILMDNDCQKIQGYYYSKPLPAKELEALFFASREKE